MWWGKKCWRKDAGDRRKSSRVVHYGDPSREKPKVEGKKTNRMYIVYSAAFTLVTRLQNRDTLAPKCRPVDTGGRGQGGNAPPIICQTCFWRRYKRSLIWQQFWQHYILATHAPPFQFSCLRACKCDMIEHARL